jgi:hypothetical protein
MKETITDPIMKKFEFNDLAKDARKHLEHLISSSRNKEDLLFKLAGFYGNLVAVLREKYD